MSQLGTRNTANFRLPVSVRRDTNLQKSCFRRCTPVRAQRGNGTAVGPRHITHGPTPAREAGLAGALLLGQEGGDRVVLPQRRKREKVGVLQPSRPSAPATSLAH